MPAYNSTGAIAVPKTWHGSVTADALGNFDADISKAGCSAVPYQVQLAPQIGALNAVAAPSAVPNPGWAPSLSSATRIKGAVVKPITLLALGLTVGNAGGAVVNLEVWCQ